MYTKGDNSFFIVDAHVALWDARPENQRNIHGKQFIDCFYDYHRNLSPESELWPYDEYLYQGGDRLMKDLFEDGYVDHAIFQPAHLGEFYVNGFGQTEEAWALTAQNPDKLTYNHHFDPRNGERGLDQLRADAERFAQRRLHQRIGGADQRKQLRVRDDRTDRYRSAEIQLVDLRLQAGLSRSGAEHQHARGNPGVVQARDRIDQMCLTLLLDVARGNDEQEGIVVDPERRARGSTRDRATESLDPRQIDTIVHDLDVVPSVDACEIARGGVRYRDVRGPAASASLHPSSGARADGGGRRVWHLAVKRVHHHAARCHRGGGACVEVVPGQMAPEQVEMLIADELAQSVKSMPEGGA